MKRATTAKLPKKTSVKVNNPDNPAWTEDMLGAPVLKRGRVGRGTAPLLTKAQKTELDRRLSDHLANPDDVVPWSEVKAAALAKIGQ